MSLKNVFQTINILCVLQKNDKRLENRSYYLISFLIMLIVSSPFIFGKPSQKLEESSFKKKFKEI